MNVDGMCTLCNFYCLPRILSCARSSGDQLRGENKKRNRNKAARPKKTKENSLLPAQLSFYKAGIALTPGETHDLLGRKDCCLFSPYQTD